MSFDLKLFAGKLVKCRENLQLQQAEVCQKTGIDLSRFQLLEKGEAVPSGDEVLMFADFFKQDYQFFITNEYKTAIEQVQILYRKHGDAFSKADRWAIQEFLFLCESEQLVFELGKKPRAEFDYRPTGTYFIGHGVEGAKALRKFLGLRTDSLVPDPYAVFRKLGVHIFRRKLENSGISGLFILHPKAGRCILINYNEDIYRQNFTIAHEMGHALFDSGEEINISFEKWDRGDLKEKRANAFASAFLIPEEELVKRKHFSWSQDILVKLAASLKVNIQPLVYAMKSAGIIDDGQVAAFINWKVPLSDKIDPELAGLSDKRYEIKAGMLARGISEFYVKSCHSAYEKGLISAQRMSEMLLVQEQELPAMLALFNLHLSYDN
jgi:Zn-dependent peptidase ImmA (M78 family)